MIFRRVFSTDDITVKNPTENFHKLYIAKTVELPYMPVFTWHVPVGNLGYSQEILELVRKPDKRENSSRGPNSYHEVISYVQVALNEWEGKVRGMQAYEKAGGGASRDLSNWDSMVMERISERDRLREALKVLEAWE